MTGTWTAENYFGGMKEGLVDIAPLNEDLVAPGTQEKVDEAKKRIVEEGFNVFDGVRKQMTEKPLVKKVKL